MAFGFKAARLLATVERHRARLAQMCPRVLVGEFGGAVGTLASLGNNGPAVQQASWPSSASASRRSPGTPNATGSQNSDASWGWSPTRWPSWRPTSSS